GPVAGRLRLPLRPAPAAAGRTRLASRGVRRVDRVGGVDPAPRVADPRADDRAVSRVLRCEAPGSEIRPPGDRSTRGVEPVDEMGESARRAHAARWRAAAAGLRRRCSGPERDRKSTRLNSSHVKISYAVFCLKKK